MKIKVHKSWSQSQQKAKSCEGEGKEKEMHGKARWRGQLRRTKEQRRGFLFASFFFPWGLIINPSCFPRVVGPLCMVLGKWLVLTNVHVTVFFWATFCFSQHSLQQVWMCDWIYTHGMWAEGMCRSARPGPWTHSHSHSHRQACRMLSFSFVLSSIRKQKSGGRWNHIIHEAELSSHHHRPLCIMMWARKRLPFCSATLVLRTPHFE